MNNKGFTLVELVMFIIIGAIFLPASMIAFTGVMNNYSRPDYYIKARFYAEQRMSELTATSYDSLIPEKCASWYPENFTVECYINGVDSSLNNNGSTVGKEPYKRIIVVVKHDRLIEDYYLRTILTRRPAKGS